MSRRTPKSRNQLLYEARKRLNLTQAAAAEAVGVSERQWRRWETTPGPDVPRAPEVLRSLCEVFQVSYDKLGFVSPVDLSPGGAGVLGGVIIPPVNRRDALAAGVAAALGGLPWLSPVVGVRPTEPLRIGEDEVEDLRAVLQHLDAWDQRFGGDSLWRSARHTLHYIHRLLDRGTFSTGVGDELQAMQGSLTTSIGWYCYDAGRTQDASVYWSQALNTALLFNNSPLAIRTLSVMARQAVDLGKGRDAVRYAQIAATRLGPWVPPRVHSLLAIREAQGHAALGDAASTNEAILRAWRGFERGASEDDPDWARFLNEAELVCLEGMCRSDLGEHEKAIHLLSRSAELQDAAHDRNRGMCLVRLSGAALSAGNLDQSIDAAERSVRMIGSGMTSRRNKQVLLGIANGLHRFNDNPHARHTIERITQSAA
ncbi:helix-turn-helix domain-containing protein [Kitasatospora sp. NPDC127121]|uniref:helix-turn-helix domain-containing protein n=1 Tax=Kitasatospora sp. NPDC127121 TaxID=3345371 RepID=UPI00362CEE41